MSIVKSIVVVNIYSRHNYIKQTGLKYCTRSGFQRQVFTFNIKTG